MNLDKPTVADQLEPGDVIVWWMSLGGVQHWQSGDVKGLVEPGGRLYVAAEGER